MGPCAATLVLLAGLGLFSAACSELAVDRCQEVICPGGGGCDPETGACVSADLCAGVLCADGASCDPQGGQCKGGVADLCRAVTCSPAQSCDAQTGACRANPPPPALSPMIVDRVGRPGIGNLLLNPFGLFKVNNVTEESDASKDRYNAAGGPGTWVGAFSPYLRLTLGIFDGLDGLCGNQFLAGAAGAARYTNLGNLLALDALLVNTAASSCTAYLAAEVGAADCGGWRPGYDVIDATYTLLSTGTIITPVGDGVPAGAPIGDFFPFLLPPP